MQTLPLQHSDQFDIDQNLIDSISQSILSNLDRDGLLNSILSLLHQTFHFSLVNLYLLRGEDKNNLKKIGVSRNGLEPELIYNIDKHTGPVSWCVKHLEGITINDTSQAGSFLPEEFDQSIKSVLVLPLIQGDTYIGVLELGADSVNAFSQSIVKSFTHLADHIAIAIRNANLYRNEQLRNAITERLHELFGPISVDLTLKEIYQRLFDELADFLPYDASAIWLFDSSLSDFSTEEYVPSFQLGGFRCKDPYDASSIEQLLQFPVDGQEFYSSYPWLTEILNSNFAHIQSTEPAYEPLGDTLGFPGPYSAIVAPLSIGNLKLGIIVCVDHTANRYDVDHLSIINTFSGFITIALENSRLYQAAHAQAWMSTVLLQVAEATQSQTNLEELIDTVVRIFPDLLGISASAIFLWDQAIDLFAYGTSFGFQDEQSTRMDNWDINQGSVRAFEEIKNSRRPVILNYESISAADATQLFPDYDLSNDLLILFPLVTQNVICGALLVDFTGTNLTLNSPQEVWDEKYALIQGAAQQTAIAIENLQLIKSQEEEAYISLALLQVAQAVVSLNQLDEILSMIVRITPILVGVKRCILYLWDANIQRLCFSQSFGFSKNELAPLEVVIKPSEFPLIEAILLNDRIIYHSLKPNISPSSWIEISPDDYQIIERVDPDSADEISITLDERSLANRYRLLIGLPLSIKNEILGIMLIEEEDAIKGSPSIHIREKRIEIVRGITQQAAISIKNELLQQEAVKSERMERELQLAREIQAAFLPDKLPDIGGWDIDARWQPARQVGGDFYDVLILDENQVGFVIADVADKGMPAALFMTLIRTLIRASAKEKLSPAEVLTQVNELLYPDAKQGMFVTVFYAVISVNSGKVIYANAGHNPPIVKRLIGNELIELTRTSIALGIFEHIQSDEHEVILNPGDWLIMYTDGVTEAFSPSEEMFGKERLLNLINSGKYNSSTDFVDLIEKTISDFILGTDLSDDLTITSVHRLKTS